MSVSCGTCFSSNLFRKMLVREVVLVLFALNGFVACAKYASLPKDFQRCYRSDSECIREATEDAFKKLKNGDESINIEALDPLVIPEIRIAQSRGPVSVSIIQRNVKLYGLTDGVRITRMDFDFENDVMSAGIFYPKVTIISDQVIDGRLLVVPVRGKGKARTIMESHNCSFTAKFQVVEKNGYNFLKFDEKDVEYHLDVKKMRLSLEDLYNGDKALNAATNKALNDNWKLIFNEMRPAYEATFSKILANAFNRFFSKVPLEEIFLD